MTEARLKANWHGHKPDEVIKVAPDIAERLVRRGMAVPVKAESKKAQKKSPTKEDIV